MKHDYIRIYKLGDKYKKIYYKFTSGGNSAGVRYSTDNNEERLKNSISRTRSKIFELAMCNNFEYFCTFTLDEKLRDRFDLNEFRRSFTQYIRNINRNRVDKIKYLLIPEQHKDGAWHLHGLLMGLTSNDLSINEYGFLDWVSYRERWGFFSCSKIKSHEACAKYITKYVTKDIASANLKSNAHLYFASLGLNRAECVYDSSYRYAPILDENNTKWEFENDYIKIKWLNKLPSELSS